MEGAGYGMGVRWVAIFFFFFAFFWRAHPWHMEVPRLGV